MADLGAICEVRPAWADGRDVVDGVQAELVARPASPQQTAELMRACHTDRLVVVPRGHGSKLSWGVPPRLPDGQPRVDVLLDTTAMDELVEHAHGDLIATVGAGMALADLSPALARAGQQLVVDDLVGRSTVGGMLATNLCGPRRLWVGSPRDLVIGLRMVRADGTIAKAGGKVVKNVAGYDLSKLLTGSYGTLGVITEATFRLHPVPEASHWVAVTTTPDTLGDALAAVRHSQLVPTAVELDAPAGTEQVRLAVLVSGTEAGSESRAAAFYELLGADATIDGDAVPPMRLPGDQDSRMVLVKMTTRLSGIPSLLEACREHQVSLRGSAGVGVFHGRVEGTLDPGEIAGRLTEVRRRCEDLGGSLVVLDAPSPLKQHLDCWGVVEGPALALMRRVKHEFDPAAILSPGRFVGGI